MDLEIIRIFVSYSHVDSAWMKRILRFVAALERRGFDVWHDEGIATGEPWNKRIKEAILHSHIALVLVSQDFLRSPYCQDVEVTEFLMHRRSRGLIIYPVILFPCRWQEEDWLSSTQTQPRGGKTVAEHFRTRAAQERLFLNISNELADIGQQLRAA